MPFKSKKKSKFHSHKPLIEDQLMQPLKDVVQSPNSQEVVDMLRTSERTKLFHPNGSSQAFIPCRVKKIGHKGKLTVEICPFMRPENGIHRFRTRLTGCKKADRATIIANVRSTPLHLISLGEFVRGRWDCAVWNWTPDTSLPTHNPDFETSINYKVKL